MVLLDHSLEADAGLCAWQGCWVPMQEPTHQHQQQQLVQAQASTAAAADGPGAASSGEDGDQLPGTVPGSQVAAAVGEAERGGTAAQRRRKRRKVAGGGGLNGPGHQSGIHEQQHQVGLLQQQKLHQQQEQRQGQEDGELEQQQRRQEDLDARFPGNRRNRAAAAHVTKAFSALQAFLDQALPEPIDGCNSHPATASLEQSLAQQQSSIHGNQHMDAAVLVRMLTRKAQGLCPAASNRGMDGAGAVMNAGGAKAGLHGDTAAGPPSDAAGAQPQGSSSAPDWVSLYSLRTVLKPRFSWVAPEDGGCLPMVLQQPGTGSTEACAEAPGASAGARADAEGVLNASGSALQGTHAAPGTPWLPTAHAAAGSGYSHSDASSKLFNALITNPGGQEAVALAHETPVLLPARSGFVMGDVTDMGRGGPMAQLLGGEQFLHQRMGL